MANVVMHEPSSSTAADQLADVEVAATDLCGFDRPMAAFV
jgi:hypothetical protein